MFNRKIADRHAWVEARLSDYIDKQLAPAERAQLDQHLRECAQCQASLASLRWTISLVKQAPAPALPRSFALPIPTKRNVPSRLTLTLMPLATAVATLLLFVVVSVDLIFQFSGAAAPAALRADPTQAIALIPTAAPAQGSKSAAEPTAAAPEAMPPAPTAALLPPAAQPKPTATPTRVGGLGAGSSETPRSAAAVDNARLVTGTPPPVPKSAFEGVKPTATIAPTQTNVIPTDVIPTPTAPSATATPAIQALTQPTRGLPPPAPIETPRPIFSTLRIAELVLLFVAVFLGTLTILVWRRK